MALLPLLMLRQAAANVQLHSRLVPRAFRFKHGPVMCSSALRFNGTSSSTNNNFSSEGEEDTTRQRRDRRMQLIMDSSLKGTAQVMFLNSKLSGKILLASLAIGDPFTAAMAALGTTSSTVAALAANLDNNESNGKIANGLYSYNGCLVGCATAVFVAPHSFVTASAITAVGAATSTFVTASLSKAIAEMPQWTLAFNIVTLTMLLRLQPLATTTLAMTVNASSDSAIAAAAVATVSGASYTTTMDLLLSPLTGLSQIFVIESALTGAGVLAAIATYSPLLAVHAVAGSLTGCLVGGLFFSGADVVAAGLWGFNSALTSMGVATFFVPTQQSTILSISGAAATAVVFGALQTVLGDGFGSPGLTLPFCITMSGCWMLGTTSSSAKPLVPGLILAKDPHSPEKNAI